MAGWNLEVGEQAEAEGPGVTLVDGSTFAVSDSNGDIGGGVHGLFMFDTRVVSGVGLSIDGCRVEPLSVEHHGPFAATFVGRVRRADGPADATLVVMRTRSAGGGMSERIEVRNYATAAVAVAVEMSVEADFASLFDVKAGLAPHGSGSVPAFVSGSTVRFGSVAGSQTWSVSVRAEPEPELVPMADGKGELRWRVEIPAGSSWRGCVEFELSIGDRGFRLAHPCGVPIERALHASRLDSWRSSVPTLRSDDPVLDAAVWRAHEDLGALRIFDPDHAERVVVAAGAPWYMTLFGRDSIITAWMALITEPDLALGVVASLADLQGSTVNPITEEQPGRILHEVRYDQDTMRTLGGRSAYYGSVDATPLFVMLVGELARWGVGRDVLAGFLPSVDAAMAWIEQFGDRDGDGYVEYQAATPSGLRNQGWKDSGDAIRYRDGMVASPPLALAEVQGYVYAAYVARAELASLFEDPGTAHRCAVRAATLKKRFNEEFWVHEHGWYAMALDADKRPVDALASNIGHCLWSGIVDQQRAGEVASRLGSPEMSSGFGLRTLASNMGGFNPLSYHCGSVWPHDSAIAVAGLARYHCDDVAAGLARGLLDAAGMHGGRLPELFGGFDRDDIGMPVRYPASCSPQAWASAAPLLMVRAMLGLEPNAAEGELRVRPIPLDGVTRMQLDGIRLNDHAVTVTVDRGDITVEGLPAGMRLEHG